MQAQLAARSDLDLEASVTSQRQDVGLSSLLPGRRLFLDPVCGLLSLPRGGAGSLGNSKVWFMFAERARVASAGPAVGGLERM